MKYGLFFIFFNIFAAAKAQDSVYVFFKQSALHQNNAVSFLSYDATMQRLYSGDAIGNIAFWTKDGTLIKTQKAHQTRITHISRKPDTEEYLTAAYDGAVKYWDTHVLKKTFLLTSIGAYETWKGNEPTFALFVPNKNEIIFGGYNAQISVGNLNDGSQKTIYNDTIGGITTAVWLDESTLAFAAANYIKLLDINTYTITAEYPTTAPVCELYTSGDKRIWAWDFNGNAILWDNFTQKNKVKASAQTGTSDMAILEQRNMLLTANEGNSATIWDSKTLKIKQILTHSTTIKTLAIENTGLFIYTGDENGVIKIWKLPAKTPSTLPTKIPPLPNTNAVIFPQGQIKVRDSTVQIAFWDDQQVDNDTISVFCNGKWILRNARIDKIKKVVNIALEYGDNELIVYAHNLGEIPPNTACLSFTSASGEQIRRVHATIGRAGSIKITRNRTD
jgi:WD40 repeat protein